MFTMLRIESGRGWTLEGLRHLPHFCHVIPLLISCKAEIGNHPYSVFAMHGLGSRVNTHAECKGTPPGGSLGREGGYDSSSPQFVPN